ncbi:O-antigen polymerase [Vibrio splendidus]|uniref:O-antigen polymerase n=1 Tax=Vibrio splendidus TaxID=29497 RepID=UPI000D3CC7BF|nr:O-antigen polymerase [Vibrio splendidus]MCC4882883.1 oligosaccharide repeat unit polymerase [Vibrio splendidus]PTO57622.1 hypothetical protein CWN96_22785 [Vibrio splendidus]
MAHFSFLIIYFLSFSYAVFRYRRFDIFSILLLSLCFYYSSAVFNTVSVFGVVENVQVDNRTYIVLFLIFSLSLFFTYINDKFVKFIGVRKFNADYLLITKFLVFSSILCFSIGVIQVGGLSVFFEGSKSNLANKSTAFYGLSIWLFSCSFAISVYFKYFRLALFTLIFILFSLIIGSRSTAVISFLLAFLLLYDFKLTRLSNLYKEAVIVIVFVSLMVVYKFIYKDIRSGEFSDIFLVIYNIDIYSFFGVLMSESSSVVYNLNTVFTQEISLPNYVLYHRLLSLLPAAGDYYQNMLGLDIPRFSYFLINEIYDLHFGLASSIFGEVIAISGWFGLVLFLLVWLLIILYFNVKLYHGMNIYQLAFLPAIIYSSFYIHRIDVTFYIGYFKYAIFICLTIYLLRVLKEVIPIRRKR